MTDAPLRQPDDAPSLSPDHEANLLGRLRRRIFKTVIWQSLRDSPLRVVLVLLLSALLWVGLYILFSEGFAFMRRALTVVPDQPIADNYDFNNLIRTVLSMFFLTMMVMLLFSSAIISFVSLFRTAETAFLLTEPIRTGRLFLHRLWETVGLSSWGFVLLGTPMLIALGVTTDAGWGYYVVMLPFIVSFIYVPSCVGAICCLLLVRFMPRISTRTLIWVGVIVLLLLLVLCMISVGQTRLITPGWFRAIHARLGFVHGRFLPSWWLSTGILEAARGQWDQAILFLTLLTANALFLRWVAVKLAERVYRKAYSRTLGRSGGRPYGHAWGVDRVAGMVASPLRRATRLVLLKDFRIFRRDPAQWSQFLIFGALLGLYFMNIRRFQYEAHELRWVNMVSFLNLSVVGLLLSTFTTRFVYPTISLEGRRMWVLGLLPIRRDSILWGKFWFAAGGALVPCCVLVLMSDLMLRVPVLIVVSHQLTCVALCFGLSGIAVGLGARLPNFREPSPAKIASGFGGTLSLVLSATFILVEVILTAVPAYFYISPSARVRDAIELTQTTDPDAAWRLILGLGVGLVIATAMTTIPMWIGIRAFRRLEV